MRICNYTAGNHAAIYKDMFWFTLLFIVTYGLFMGGHPIIVSDEGRYSEVAREMWATHHYITPTVNGVLFLDKPPLFYWLQISAFTLFGVKEWTIRLWPTIFAWLGCIITYTTAYLLFNRKTAIVAALLLASSPLYFSFAHFSNLDLEVAVLISGSLFGFLLAVRSGIETLHIKPLYFSYFCAALACMTKGLMGLVFPMMIIGSWIMLGNRWRVIKKMHLWQGLLLIAVICAPWFIIVQQHNPEFMYYFFYVQQFSRYVSTGFNNHQPLWFYAKIVCITLLPWSIAFITALVVNLKQGKKCWQQPITSFLLLWISLIFIFFSLPASKLSSYILPIFPALALFTADYLQQYSEKNSWLIPFYARYYPIILIILGLGLLFIAGHPHIHVSKHAVIMPYAEWVLGIAILIYGIIGVALFRRLSTIRLYQIIAVLTLAVLTCGNYAAGFMQLKPSTKILAQQITAALKPNDIVVTYHNYYQDFPLYLQHEVYIVYNWNDPALMHDDHWQGQFAKLLSFQPAAHHWLISDATFWPMWNSHQRVWVVLNTEDIPQFQVNSAKPVYQIDSAGPIALISNQAS